ncbi:MAG: ATP-binding protein, partial [Desulfovermiculus sp.]
IKEELQDLEEQLEEQNKTFGQVRHEFACMDGSDQAAQKAEEAQQELASIRRQAERFTRLRLASLVLEEAIERYRTENQDPVLALAGQYFRELTLGSFSSLRTDVDDRGEQVIVGLRGDADRVQVQGMSDGTRDQLYLALRLASLEYRLEKSEPMPFIVDDILVNFDEERTRAALQAMARLGEKNQVLVFSHHRQVADAVRELNLGQVHELG